MMHEELTVRPEVKQLTWKYVSSDDALCGGHMMAEALGGAYHIIPDEDSDHYWILQWTLRTDDFCMNYGGPITRHPGPEAAQKAAQSDYEVKVNDSIV